MLKKTSINQSKDQEILYQLLVKEHGYYRAILEMTQLENEKLQNEDPLEELNQLLKKKKLVLDSIQEIESSMKPLKKAWLTMEDPSNPFYAQIEDELTLLNKLLKQILQLDLINQKIMGNYVSHLKDQINHNPSEAQYGEE